ncbi:hypothetical protein CSUB01_11085 [Colletotrichum sublineola]|uniref:Uncharacterized protein n=1 Tax=Colletotrichum sublineola TaxID=1173701 RepID=A0A066WZD4_COLSU|nr:hypothetical protein CSUB01_11085 [Colletotrichum sublineola]
MPPSPSLLAQCSSTLWCHLRSLPLWAFVLIVLLLGAVRQRVLPSRPPPPRRPATAAAVADKTRTSPPPSHRPE